MIPPCLALLLIEAFFGGVLNTSMGHWSAHDAQNTDVTFHGIARRLVEEKQFGQISGLA